MEEQKLIKSEFAIASLVIGIASFVNLFNIEKSAAAIIFGILALRKMAKNEGLSGKNFAIIGVVLGSLSVVATAIVTIKYWPQIQQLIQQVSSPK